MNTERKEPSLTHVCMWSNKDKNWKRTSAEEAAKLFPNGSVSAKSGLFMCEFCGQSVTLTAGRKYIRYFRHSSAEEDKSCPERTHGTGKASSDLVRKLNLPFRLIYKPPHTISFEIGLFRVPDNLLIPNPLIEIRPESELSPGTLRTFSGERLTQNGITYLPVGEEPFEKYRLSLKSGREELYKFWPKEIDGIHPEGTLFDTTTRKKLPYGADVEAGKEYYLLWRTDRSLIFPSEIQKVKVAAMVYSNCRWSLYKVSAEECNEDTAKFYLQFHCRLTDCPISLHPVWPLYTENSGIIIHNGPILYMLAVGNIDSLKSFPGGTYAQSQKLKQQQKLYQVICSGKQQLVSAIRLRPLQYTYLWKEPLCRTAAIPGVSVIDPDSASEIFSGQTDKLPRSKTLRIHTDFDGEIILSKDGHIISRQKISAEKTIFLNHLFYGLHIQVVIGLDTVRDIFFQKPELGSFVEEKQLFRQITSASGAFIPIPHALRNILAGMNHYPQICRWIRKRIQSGMIREQSYRRLQAAYLKIKNHR